MHKFFPVAYFCERVNSVAKDIMTDAPLFINDDAPKMMVVLLIATG